MPKQSKKQLKSLRRVCGGIGIAVALGAASTLTAPGAGAAPMSAEAASLPSGLVTAIHRDLHMSPDEYLERAADAKDVAAAADRMRAAHPETIGAAWLDDDGTPTIAVTTARAADRVREAGYTPRRVEPAEKDAAPGAGGGPSTIRMTDADGPMGGDGYAATDGPIENHWTYTSCSFGFPAVDAEGDPLVLSAGHCDPNPSAAGGSDAARVYALDSGGDPAYQIGAFWRSGVGAPAGNLDYSVIALAPDAADMALGEPAVRGQGGEAVPITGVATPVVGTPACGSGATTGYSCGKVTTTDHTVISYDGGIISLQVFGYDGCTDNGDSGGAVVTGTQALGIINGSRGSDCGDMTSWAIPVHKILQRVDRLSGKCVAVRTTADPDGDCDPADGGGGIGIGGGIDIGIGVGGGIGAGIDLGSLGSAF